MTGAAGGKDYDPGREADRLRFEAMLADVSARFVNLPADEVDTAIRDAQRQVCECLGFDQSGLWQSEKDDPRMFVLTHYFRPPGKNPVPERVEAAAYFPWTLRRVLAGEVVALSSTDAVPAEGLRDLESWRHFGVKTALVVPLAEGGGKPFGILSFGDVTRTREWPETLLVRLRVVAQIFGNALLRRRADEALRQALTEVQNLRQRLENENLYLRGQVLSATSHGTIVGESEPVKQMLVVAQRVAAADTAVLITGETGTGKELLARAIHDWSGRKDKVMVTVNCAALPAPLIESELFGREKGAYTGALTQQMGRFELADGSTLFLDEIGDLPLDLQVKLLRVLQDGCFERLGSHRTLQTNVRIIAATHRDLGAMVRAGQFREDLFHRLNVFPIEVPPLRARVRDIPLLVWKVVEELNTRMGRAVDTIPRATLEALKRHPWPGNIRELRNLIERAMIVSDGQTLVVDLPRSACGKTVPPTDTLEDVERQHILSVLERTHWRVSGPGGAARILGLVPTTLQSRMKRLGLTRPKP